MKISSLNLYRIHSSVFSISFLNFSALNSAISQRPSNFSGYFQYFHLRKPDFCFRFQIFLVFQFPETGFFCISSVFSISFLNFSALNSAISQRPSTPIPFWLKTPEEEEVPEIELPKTSEDLLIDSQLTFKAAGVYEVLRHYYLILRLSLFRFEDFCAALASEEQSNLLSEVHIALLKAIVR